MACTGSNIWSTSESLKIENQPAIHKSKESKGPSPTDGIAAIQILVSKLQCKELWSDKFPKCTFFM